jgi:hypothetical protein
MNKVFDIHVLSFRNRKSCLTALRICLVNLAAPEMIDRRELNVSSGGYQDGRFHGI